VTEAGLDFTAFVADRHAGLLRFAMVLTGDARLAEEIVADVLDRAYEQWDRIGVMDKTHGYVRRMVVNDYLSWRRRLRRTFPVAALDELAGIEPDHADAHTNRTDMHARLAALPARQRACLVLRYYEDLTDAEIADLLGCAIGTVRSNISRALAALRIDLAAVLPRTRAVPKET
jgi:RNA polymerase sigma-70 factor (sigma-E family)